MHILDDYLTKFEKALETEDFEEALFQIHQMLQRDPLDQRKYIQNSLEQFHSRTGDLDEEKLEKSKREYSALDKQIEQMNDEQLELAYGDALQLFDLAPNKWALRKVELLAEHLIKRNLLEKAEYELEEVVPPQKPDEGSSNPSITKRESDSSLRGRLARRVERVVETGTNVIGNAIESAIDLYDDHKRKKK